MLPLLLSFGRFLSDAFFRALSFGSSISFADSKVNNVDGGHFSLHYPRDRGATICHVTHLIDISIWLGGVSFPLEAERLMGFQYLSIFLAEESPDMYAFSSVPIPTSFHRLSVVRIGGGVQTRREEEGVLFARRGVMHA